MILEISIVALTAYIADGLCFDLIVEAATERNGLGSVQL